MSRSNPMKMVLAVFVGAAFTIAGATQAAADEGNARAAAALGAADIAGAASSRYVLTSVLFASVLFLAGIAAKLSNPRLAHIVVAVAGVALVAALWLLLTAPLIWSGI